MVPWPLQTPRHGAARSERATWTPTERPGPLPIGVRGSKITTLTCGRADRLTAYVASGDGTQALAHTEDLYETTTRSICACASADAKTSRRTSSSRSVLARRRQCSHVAPGAHIDLILGRTSNASPLCVGIPMIEASDAPPSPGSAPDAAENVRVRPAGGPAVSTLESWTKPVEAKFMRSIGDPAARTRAEVDPR